jgi:hypothetical protein
MTTPASSVPTGQAQGIVRKDFINLMWYNCAMLLDGPDHLDHYEALRFFWNLVEDKPDSLKMAKKMADILAHVGYLARVDNYAKISAQQDAGQPHVHSNPMIQWGNKSWEWLNSQFVAVFPRDIKESDSSNIHQMIEVNYATAEIRLALQKTQDHDLSPDQVDEFR